MNIFIIPSWYPSIDFPHAGIFIKEQAQALAEIFPSSNFAVSTWGSHEKKLQLWGKDHIENLYKIIYFHRKSALNKKISANLIEYYSPSLTWSRKIFEGNIRNITANNEKHFLDFQSKVGKVQVIHAHSAYPAGWVAMELGKRYKIPYLITEHMGPFPFKDFLHRSGRLSKFLQNPFTYSYCNIAVSNHQKDVMNEWAIPNLKSIPNLTSETFFLPTIKKKKEAGTIELFTLARLEWEKGIPVLLNAIQKLKKNNKIFLRIGGDGSQKEMLLQMAATLKVADNIQWLGTLSREQALNEFQACDAFVLPSLYENLPLVLLEAIACGKPIISTRCGGPESIINNINGLLAEPGNVESLYQALRTMIDNIAQYKAEEIRADFCQKYSKEVVCDQIMEVYKEAITNYQAP